MSDYQEFLEQKALVAEPCGMTYPRKKILSALDPFQTDIVEWALRRGRSAIFADCGLGKTPMQLDWLRIVTQETNCTGLIVAPLAVSSQTADTEGPKFGIKVHKCREQSQVVTGAINITNYESLHKFDADAFGGIVLDESSILKGFSGVYRKMLGEFAESIPYRLACTATPAPNDLIEITNHAEFLGIMSGKEIIALFFTQDGNTTHRWRLKGHAETDFWKWLASWSVAIRSPSDLGYDDEKFILPPLNIQQHQTQQADCGDSLFPMEAITMDERRKARRESIQDRVALTASIVQHNGEASAQWLIWCDLNKESEMLTRSIPGAVEVKGADSNEHKEKSLLGFSSGDIRVLVTKPSIAGFGMNWQRCHNMAFVGLSDSYEKYYQAMRRCWRFGQKETVNVHIVTVDTEGAVVRNIERKEKQATEMFNNVVKHMKGLNMQQTQKEEMAYATKTREGTGWKMMMGDCVERIADVESESVGLSVFSPPFPGMYAYTNSRHDMGNVKSMGEMIEQYSYLAPELLRVVKPGRSACVHLCQGVAFKGTDGYIGIKDFRGEVIRVMEAAGWIYYGEVCIDKDPQIKAIRTKDAGLLFKSLARDSSRMHMALADYILQFRKPGENAEPIKAGISERYQNMGGWITSEEWIEWAAPVWYRQTKDYPGGIRETDVLNKREGKDKNDEKHICPLQLGVIERCVKLWSNPGDLVLSPFAGIGSEGYTALRFARQFVGIELKESYYETALRNMKRGLASKAQPDLFDAQEENP